MGLGGGAAHPQNSPASQWQEEEKALGGLGVRGHPRGLHQVPTPRCPQDTGSCSILAERKRGRRGFVL